jgi:hypothetical protein
MKNVIFILLLAFVALAGCGIKKATVPAKIIAVDTTAGIESSPPGVRIRIDTNSDGVEDTETEYSIGRVPDMSQRAIRAFSLMQTYPLSDRRPVFVKYLERSKDRELVFIEDFSEAVMDIDGNITGYRFHQGSDTVLHLY